MPGRPSQTPCVDGPSDGPESSHVCTHETSVRGLATKHSSMAARTVVGRCDARRGIGHSLRGLVVQVRRRGQHTVEEDVRPVQHTAEEDVRPNMRV